VNVKPSFDKWLINLVFLGAHFCPEGLGRHIWQGHK
jgi:hypothetical protein